ncbi:methyltransferase domain-containing protein [Falsirhodobacter xinxiangensis]|uniref:methyltransferase domain-containing protein n=1 Tax=Falsirhodobacter xinxiangensis TaxID=2530049 RepID=UPI001FE8247C|nr:methyltransferase domain-containing protein [Rhodobacter xinxiangensis]
MRPALDLLAQVGELPDGGMIDLGCGDGAVAGALSTLGRPLIGVDTSAEMLAEAQGYDRLVKADIAEWQPDAPPALIFSNAALQWLDGHETLLPRLAGMLAPGGVLAVQMPRQEAAPSHRFMRDIALAMFAGRFLNVPEFRVLAAQDYAAMLAPLGEVTAWETEYVQRLAPAEGHPVRHFTQSTGLMRFTSRMDAGEVADYVAAYDSALAAAYPLQEDGSVLFPFRRCFFTLRCPR